jgi:hypothetical protein
MLLGNSLHDHQVVWLSNWDSERGSSENLSSYYSQRASCLHLHRFLLLDTATSSWFGPRIRNRPMEDAYDVGLGVLVCLVQPSILHLLFSAPW